MLDNKTAEDVYNDLLLGKMVCLVGSNADIYYPTRISPIGTAFELKFIKNDLSNNGQSIAFKSVRATSKTDTTFSGYSYILSIT